RQERIRATANSSSQGFPVEVGAGRRGKAIRLPCPNHHLFDGLRAEFEFNADILARNHAHAWLVGGSKTVPAYVYRVETGVELINDGAALCVGFHRLRGRGFPFRDRDLHAWEWPVRILIPGNDSQRTGRLGSVANEWKAKQHKRQNPPRYLP